MRPPRAALALAVALAACGASQDDHSGHEEAAGVPATPDAHRTDDLLRIDPEMLRDLRVTTSAVESRPGGEGVTALGELGVDEETYAEVGSPIAARVADVLAGVGDAVTAGQALATLESVELGRLRAELLAARARAELARQALARKRGLAAERIVSPREVQEASAAAATAEAEVRAAEATLGAIGIPIGEGSEDPGESARFQLRAPLPGVVIERDLVRGQVAEPSRPLFRIANLARLWLMVHAFERDAVRLTPGAEARVTLAALPGRVLPGVVALVGRRVEASSRTVPVRIELPNPDGVLRPGMSASAWMALGGAGESLVAVPAAALQRLHDGWAVFLPHQEGAFEIRPVGRGRDLGGEVEIVTGLRPGEMVVVEGAFLLKAEAEKARGEGEHHDH